MVLGIVISSANRRERTGVEWYAFSVLEAWKKILPREVVVRLYTDAPLVFDISKNIPNHWQVRVLGWPPKRLWTQLRLSVEMLLNPPDVLFVPAHTVPLIHPKKTVMTVHDIAAVRFPQSYNWFERWYSVWSAKYAVKHLWKVIVPSQYTKDEMVLAFGLSDTKNISVIPHGYDSRRYYQFEHEKEIKEMSGKLEKLNITKPYLMTIGRLEEKKNTARIIAAFDELKKQGGDIQLLLVGKPGFGYEKVAEAIRNSPFQKDILVPGWVAEEDIPYLYNGAEVFLFPSLCEGFGLPVLEAMACGVPIVTSKGSCLEDVGGEVPLYVDPLDTGAIASAAARFFNDPSLREQRKTQGLLLVQDFSWERCAGQTADVLLG